MTQFSDSTAREGDSLAAADLVNDDGVPMVGGEEFTPTIPTMDVDLADAAVPSGTGASAVQPDAVQPDAVQPDAVQPDAVHPEAVHPDTLLAMERLDDLQRLQAEYVNYKRRVDRDRALIQERAVHDVIEAMLPVLDDIHGAREHGDLTGPFAAIAEKLETTLGRFGAERFGEVGIEFDPMQHEALMHIAAEVPEGAVATTVVQVLQPGYRVGDRIIRPARVAVADPA